MTRVDSVWKREGYTTLPFYKHGLELRDVLIVTIEKTKELA